MIKFRHCIHVLIAFFTDLFSLGRALFAQLQGQWFCNNFHESRKKDSKLCVLGNGQSLLDIIGLLYKFDDVDFCAVNKSILTDIFWEIKPKIYSFTDRVYHTLDTEDIKNVRSKILDINWSIAICIPYHYPKWFADHCKQNPNVKIYQYNTQPWYPELKFFKSFRMFLYKHGLCAPSCTNVLIPAIFSSILLGYKQIYLLGAEHSWMKDIKVNDKNEVIMIDNYYYEGTEHVWLNYDGEPIKIADLCESLYYSFRSHHDLEEFSHYLGDVKIFNCTKDSYIDAYEKKDFEFIFK